MHTLLYIPQLYPALVSHVHHCEKQCNHHSLYHCSRGLTHVHTCGEGMAGTRLLELIASPLCKEHTIIIIIIMFAAFITYLSSSLSSTPRLSSLCSHIGSSSNSSKSSTSISSASNNCITSRVHKRSSIVGGVVQLLIEREFVQRNASKACGNRLWALVNLRMTHNLLSSCGKSYIAPRVAAALREPKPSLVNQTIFRKRACASERGRGRRENTVWPNSPGFRGHDKILS